MLYLIPQHVWVDVWTNNINNNITFYDTCKSFSCQTFETYPYCPTDKTARCRATIVFHRVAAASFQCLLALNNVTSCLVVHSSNLKMETGGSAITYPPIIFWKTKLYFTICILLNDFLVFEAVVIRCKAIHNVYTVVQKGALFSGSRIYNYLPIHIKSLSTDFKQFKHKLKAFLLEHSCYSLEEFYQITSTLT